MGTMHKSCLLISFANGEAWGSKRKGFQRRSLYVTITEWKAQMCPSLLDDDDVCGDAVAVDPDCPRLGHTALAPRVHHRHRIGSAVVHLDIGHVVDGRQEVVGILGHVWF